jgi:hypothetical protein
MASLEDFWRLVQQLLGPPRNEDSMDHDASRRHGHSDPRSRNTGPQQPPRLDVVASPVPAPEHVAGPTFTGDGSVAITAPPEQAAAGHLEPAGPAAAPIPPPDPIRGTADEQTPAHYAGKFGIQVWDIIDSYRLGFYEGVALTHLLRHASTQDPDDLVKARHYLDTMLQRASLKPVPDSS